MAPKSSSTRSLLTAAALLMSVLLSPARASGSETCPAGARSMLEAAEQRLAQDVEGALRDLELVIQSFGDSSCAAQALLKVAKARYEQLGEIEVAREVAQRLVTQHPVSISAASGHALLGRIMVESAVTREELEQGRELLRRAWVLFPSSQYPALEARAGARVLDGETALRLGDLDGAAKSFLSVIEDEPPSAWLPRAEISLASILAEAGLWPAAAELLQASVDRYQGSAADESAVEAPAWHGIALRRLTLLHRLQLLPATGETPWSRAETVQIGGTGITKPELIAAREDGQLIVAGNPRDQVSVLDSDASIVRNLSSVESRCLFWTEGSQPYRCGRESIVGISGGAPRQFLDPDKANKPIDKLERVEQADLGAWYVLADRQVRLIQNNGSVRVLVDSSSSTQPVDLAVDRRHRLYVLDSKGRRVLRFDASEGRLSTAVSGGWRDPVALAVDPLGNIYVLDEERGVSVYAPDGSRIASIGPALPGATLERPEDLAVDGRGRLFVADASLKRVIVVD